MLNLTEFNRDDFLMAFSDAGDMLHTLSEIETYGRWERHKVSRLKFKETGAPLDLENIEPSSLFSGATLLDTMNNTGLYIQISGSYLPLRGTAMKTVFERAKLGGYVLKKLPKNELAKILNTCVKYAGGTALVRFLGEKVSAVHGGDRCDYVVLPMPELFSKANYFLKSRYGSKAEMKKGEYTHALTTALWMLPEIKGQPYLAYRQAAEANGYSVTDFVPTVRIISSDIGISAATIPAHQLRGLCGC